MPIEIKEIVIRTTVEKDHFSRDSVESEGKKMEEMKREILRSCEQLISKVIKGQNRR